MNNRSIVATALLAMFVSWVLTGFTWAVVARRQRQLVVMVARSERGRERVELLLDRQHREAAELKAAMADLLRRLDGAEPTGTTWGEFH